MSRKKKEVQRDLAQKVKDMRSLSVDKERVEEFRALQDEVEAITAELNQINLDEAAERALAGSRLDEDVKVKARQFSFAKFFRELAAGELTGVEAEMADLAKSESSRSGVTLKGVGIPTCVLSEHSRAFAGMSATGGTDGADGGVTIATTLQYQDELRKRLVLSAAGAQYISGLQGDISVVDGTSIDASWEGENTTVTDTTKTFSQRKLSPKRLAITVPISKQLIVQSSWDVERMILNDIMSAHAQALEEAAINGSGTGEPTGLLNTTGVGSVAIGANGGAATFKTMVDLETAVAVRNADLGSLCYVTNSKVRGSLKTTLRDTGVSGYIWDRNEVNGYRAMASNIVPADITKGTGTGLSAAIFGNFADLLICQWGGLDIIVDPYSLKKDAAIEITMNAYHDVFVRRAESFAVIKDIKA